MSDPKQILAECQRLPTTVWLVPAGDQPSTGWLSRRDAPTLIEALETIRQDRMQGRRVSHGVQIHMQSGDRLLTNDEIDALLSEVSDGA
ncbi:hypothetical protein GCM10007989_24520 [Devosia pacifica]|uniref:Uncharacterized protein n=1 Tax=Devosia pacifica TaxID=1335967 RepID=A0A918S747_9HYPH|nr:hypothetical protein [Devosia pacifica]GHA27731.1 hypothetical protein GCM10007989_24520 [Devosia pacifica]